MTKDNASGAGMEPAAKVLFRQDDDGLEPVMFYGPGSEPDPSQLKERFVIRDVWLSPPSDATRLLAESQAHNAKLEAQVERMRSTLTMLRNHSSVSLNQIEMIDEALKD